MDRPHANSDFTGEHRHSADFFHGDVERGLERMRRRLLDLTNRNRLLNFRHTKRSSLRVVDEVPDQLFELLIDGKELLFRPVPEPLRRDWIPVDIDEQEADQAPEPDEPAELPLYGSRLRKPKPHEYAERLGIATSFDLPSASGVSRVPHSARHRDREIQTLHYPDELEGILRSISSAARLAIEETGTNMLYLVMGFLQWREGPDSAQDRFAPLVLVPVSLERRAPDPVTRTYRYALRYLGEDVVANICLQEKMRQDFGLELPSFEEDDTPETHCERVRAIIAQKEGWQVRRQVTLTLLSFGKLLMYRDLDPRTWPPDKGPDRHPRVRELFEGIQHTAIGIAPDYPIDDPAHAKRVPPLIDNADVSQHSALIDAMNGKNLVIQGPPGTGKSQTISNLIAAAMADGKTVLFVSEKLAALEVVRDRLNKAGLGLFCLELHSHKTQKRALLDDIKARLDARGTFSEPRLLDEKIEHLENTKRRLTEYVELINSGYGGLGLSIYDTIWWCRRCKTRLSDDLERLDKATLTNAKSMSLAAVEERRELLSSYATHLRNVLTAAAKVSEHPWYGVTNASLNFLDIRSVVTPLEDLVAAADELLRWLAWLEERTSFAPEPRREPVREFLETVAALPRGAEGILADLLPVLRSAPIREGLQTFGARLDEYRDLAQLIGEEIGSVPRWNRGDCERAANAAQFVLGELPDAVSLEDAEECVDTLRQASKAISDGLLGATAVSSCLGLSSVFTREALPCVQAALELSVAAPVGALHLRHRGLEDEAALPSLEAAIRDAEALRAIRAQLSQHFDLGLAPPLEVLKQYAVAISNARWWSFLDSKFRAAKRAYRAVARGVERPKRRQMSESLRTLVSYFERLERFSANHAYREASGVWFDGIDTPLEELLSAAQWLGSLQARPEFLGTAGEAYRTALWTAPADRIRGLKGVAARDPQVAASLAAAVAALAIVDSHVQASRKAQPTDDLAAYAAGVTRLADDVGNALSSLRELGVPARYALRSVPSLADRIQRLHDLASVLAADEEARRALGSHFQGVATEFDTVTRTIEFFDEVMASGVPEGVGDWLLAEDTLCRLQMLHEKCDAARERLAEFQRAAERFSRVAGLDSEKWFAVIDLQERERFGPVRRRAERALASRDLLPAWLEYAQARQRAADAKLQFFIDLAEEGTIDPSSIVLSFEYVLSNTLVKSIFSERPSLAQFSGLTHEQIRQRFAELDEEVILLTRQRIAAILDRRQPPLGVGVGPVRQRTELSLIDHELSKQRRHIPIRQLVQRAGRALRALKPCFMMGPLSVAQYLPPGALEFDLVIMDEASQLKPEDAIGSICRAKQVVIVGDPMQLPPTSFFERIGDEEDVDEQDYEAIAEAESILDIARHVYKPTRLLRWHYRSRHGSLIAFSNKEFYKDQLVVFPSPIAKSLEYGIKFVHVPNGVYDNRKNVIEARRVVEAAFQHMRKRPHESLGIVTLNTVQRELIENEIEQRLKTDPYALRFVEAHENGLEPLFIKNLENVQGDERDVIYVSVTYGPNRSGRVFQRFGPINGPTGHRRLNVLFTRARRRLAVFSSILPEQIVVDPESTSWGVRALQGYLAYARTGLLERAVFTGREPDSDFEIEVADALRSRGYEVVAQVGIAGYFIDLAVKHPERPDAFILGIECDGATYHSSRSARDRDRLREMILRDLGWQIVRIWSTDWFKDPAGQVDRVAARIRQIINEEKAAGDLHATDSTPAESEADYASETPGQRALTVQEARQNLIEFREQVIARHYPNTPPGACILRDEMIEALLRYRPRDRGEWLGRIPFDLRIDTDGEQMQFLDAILDVISRIDV